MVFTDIWSLGIILYMLVAGQAPFQEANDSETLTKIMDVKYTYPATVDKDCRELIGMMLVRRPENRSDLEQIRSHKWLKGCEDIVEEVSSNGRGLTERGKKHVIQMMVEGGVVSDGDEVLR